jgi:hypothetical protein
MKKFFEQDLKVVNIDLRGLRGQHRRRGRRGHTSELGAGITTAPMECFDDALTALAEMLPSVPESKRGAS